ncbi:MAG: transglutaminase family protein [Planctomycetes bacterium]|nr:transglutaminase family protein [Planctomycetota bacterium]
MALRVALHHQTKYRYDRLVNLGPQVIRLRPAPHCRTPIHSYSLTIEPQPHFINWQQDPQGNFQARVVFPEKVTEFAITVDLVAEMTVINPFAFFLEPEAMEFPFAYDEALKKELRPYLECLPVTPALKTYLAAIKRTSTKTNDFLVDLNRQLALDIRYMIRMEPGVQTPEETLTKCSGSCRDSAWLLVQILRNLGLATRFTSGYLIQLVADVKPLEGPEGTTTDFTDLHAWTEVYLPGAGWVGLDPTSGLFTGEGHIPLASTPDPSSAAPVSGGVDECETEFDFAMDVKRIREDPRVTKPYTEEQWQAIDALGDQVDKRLVTDDVRLSMGGEPTFIAIDDPDGAEWNIAADGPTKRVYAERLMRRLHARFSPFGLLHYGQGKWYPGEQLPRWALGTFWRRDGEPVWHDHSLIASYGTAYKHDESDAQRLVQEIAKRLGVKPELAAPAYEDVWYYLARERRLPVNVDPFTSNLKDPLERERFARLFEQGIDKTIGYVLPLARYADGWHSGTWPVRTGKLLLIPGDSPMGYRLPMDSLPWVKPEDYPYLIPLDPSIPQKPLAPAAHFHCAMRARAGQSPDQRFLATDKTEPEKIPRPMIQQLSADHIIRTSLCVEARDGRLHVFLPPTRLLDDYLEVITAVEDAARITGMPVMLEGYQPPHDARINVLKVTPDPGVIEVNIHPSTTWRDSVEITNVIYDEARSCRLDSQKFMIDGRHVGTGGGNHITVGGATPSDSPFLRRPDLLRSMVGYWNNHPSLSFLFSGMFVGPTSQAPRVDDARSDSVYELEIAFRQLNREGTTPPWLVDRLFRNLLVDVTGNTHRSEFSIDKLYAPDSSTGRLGLLELRGFEMPPHARMSCAQQLLVRGLISHFWRQPYQHDLVRWGTELHDRFLLPHFVQRDFADVLIDLKRGGLAFEPAWFAPHQEFRFPLLGEVAHDHVALELRQAIEPWHVLGEDPGPGGTARYVDSSLERVQITAKGLVTPRHVVTCNGRPVPMHPTGVNGEFVAGVRYRAWQPPNCLHPTIRPHVPLVFDLVDTWSGRSIGGCTYHVAHPGGLSYERAPVNSFSAEARRGDRFQPFGHTPGPMAVTPEACSSEHPFTLDLRR